MISKVKAIQKWAIFRSRKWAIKKNWHLLSKSRKWTIFLRMAGGQKNAQLVQT